MTNPTPRYRDIDAERRNRAAACVARHIDDLRRLLEADDLACAIVEGSAVAAEVFLADSNTLHTAVRVAVHVPADGTPAFDRVLRAAGFARTEPVGDETLLRLAGRGGRRAIHVLYEGDGQEPSSRTGDNHPGSPAAARARAERLRRAFEPLSAAFRRVHHRAARDHDVTESFEVQLIERPLRGPRS